MSKDPLAGVVNHEKELAGSDIDVVAKGGHGGDGSMSIIEAMHNHRRLTARQIQLLSIAGTIGEWASLFSLFPILFVASSSRIAGLGGRSDRGEHKQSR
jgi:hypothetical protein